MEASLLQNRRTKRTDDKIGRFTNTARAGGMCAFAALNVWPHNATAADKMPVITVKAAKHAYHNCFVSVVMPSMAQPKMPTGKMAEFIVQTDEKAAGSQPAQVSETDGKTVLSFLINDLPQGATRVYHLSRKIVSEQEYGKQPNSVMVKPNGADLDVSIGATGVTGSPRLFTRYTTHSGPNKPFFYPILTPGGQPLTRQWPLDPNSTESHDHPHHRGLWFTHSDLNGIDFWTEVDTPKIKVGKTIAKGFENITSGPIFGSFRTRTEWRAPDDKLVATDVREVRVYPLDGKPDGDRVLDFDIAITPAGEPLKWGDNKDGTFGLRLPDTLAPAPEKSAHLAAPTGHIESASGLKDGAAWGKPNEWVDYYGPVGGQTYGVAMFDSPQNLRHPTTWHARDYGLFSANPFGLHDFKLGDKGAGDYTQPADKTLTFRYRILFHQGDTTAAHVAEQYLNYADPPDVSVK